MSNVRQAPPPPSRSGTTKRKTRAATAATARGREPRRTVVAVAAAAERKTRVAEPADPCSAFDTGSCGSCRREVAQGAAQCCAECLDENNASGGGPTVQCRRVPAPGSRWCREHQTQCAARVERYKSVEREYEAATPKARGLFRELIGAAPFRFGRWAGLSAHALDRAESTVRVARARRVESHQLCHAHCSDREHEHVIRRYAEWLVEFRAYRRQRDERRRRAVESAKQEREVARERAFERFGIGEDSNSPEYGAGGGERKTPPTEPSERHRSRESSSSSSSSAARIAKGRTRSRSSATGRGGRVSESVRSRRISSISSISSGSDSDGKDIESGATSGSDTGREPSGSGNASAASGAESVTEEEEEEEEGTGSASSTKTAKERQRARAKKTNRKRRERARQEEEQESRAAAERLRRLYNEPEIRIESLAAPSSGALVTTLGVRQWRATAPGLIDRPIRVRYPDAAGAPAYLYQRADTTPDRVYIRRRGSPRAERRVVVSSGAAAAAALEPGDLPREITDDEESELLRADATDRDTPTRHLVYGVRDNENLTRLLAYLRLVFADRDPDVLATRAAAMAAVGYVRPFTFDAYVGFFEYTVLRWATQQMAATSGDSNPQPLESRRALAFVDVASIRYESMDDTVRALVELATEHTKATLVALLTDELSSVGETRHRQQQQQEIDALVAQQPEDALDVFYLLRDPALPKREQALRSYVFVTLLGIALQRVRVLASVNYAVLDSEFERATQVPVRSSTTGQVRYVAPPSLVPEYLGRAAVSSHTHPIDADVLVSVASSSSAAAAAAVPVSSAAPPPARSPATSTRKKSGAASKPPSQLSPDPFASLNPAAIYSPVILRPVSHDPNWRPESRRTGRKAYASQLSPYEFASIHPAAL